MAAAFSMKNARKSANSSGSKERRTSGFEKKKPKADSLRVFAYFRGKFLRP
jgi:hypothetical protein